MNYVERIKQLREKLPSFGCDAILIEKECDLFYLTGLKLSVGTLVIHSQGGFLLVDSRYLQICEKASPLPVFLSDKVPLSTLLNENSFIRRIGFDSEAITYKRFQELQQLSTNPELIPLESSVKWQRMLKQPEEISLLRHAAELGSQGFDFVASILKEGITENELAIELDIFWRRRGGKAFSFDPIIAFGANSAMPHYRSENVPLMKGMSVLIDIGVNYQNYLSDMTRVVFFGEVDPQMKKIYSIVAQAQRAALALCRPGTLIGALDKTARDHIASQGYQFGHSLGHGVGLEIHELPMIRQKSPYMEMALQPGMVITIEPGIYLPEIGGVRLEDTVVITDSGHENLTKRPLLDV